MILVTGFEPFGELTRNPTGDAALALDGGDVRGAVLPVDYARVGPAIDALLAERWDAVVLTGVAPSRPGFALEKVAINFRDSRSADNAGFSPAGDAVVPGGPAAYFSSLPLERLRDDLTAAGLPAGMSLSAGAYLCNAAFYLARHRLDAAGTPCGFIHVPLTPDLASERETPLAFDDLLRGLRLVIDRLAGA